MALALRQHCQGRKWDFWTSCQNPELLDLRLKAYQMFCAVRNHSPGYYESWQRKKLLYFCIQFLDFCSSSVSRSMETIFPHFFPSFFFSFFSLFSFLSSTALEVRVALHGQPGCLVSQIHGICGILILTCYHSDCYGNPVNTWRNKCKQGKNKHLEFPDTSKSLAKL